MKRPTLEYAENCTLIHTYARKLEEYCDELEKALDKACKLIIEAVSQDCTIFDEVIEEEYMWRTEIDEWKELLIKNGEIK